MGSNTSRESMKTKMMVSARDEIGTGQKFIAGAAAAISVATNAAALLSLWVRGLDLTIHDYLNALVTAYRELTAPFFEILLLPAISTVARLIHLNIALQPHAADIFAFLFSYFALFAAVTLRLNHLWRLALYYVLFGTLSSFLSAAIFGAIVVQSSFQSIVVPYGFTTGLCIFTFATSLRAAIFFPRKNESRRASFGFYSRHAWRYLIVGAITPLMVYPVYAFVSAGEDSSSPLGFGILCTSLLYLFLGFYRFVLGPWSGNMHSTKGHWLGKRLNSGEGLTGFYLMLVVSIVTLLLLLNVVYLLVGRSS